MDIYVDIDNTICQTGDGSDKYVNSVPLQEKIAAINALYDEGNRITYWTARGNLTGTDQTALTKSQLEAWECKYHELRMGKPSYDLLIDDKALHPDQVMATPRPSKKISPTVVKKGWGHEVVFVNNELYCGKILHFTAGSKFSMHYHMRKKESWYVSTGLFLFKYIDTSNADIIELELAPGDAITNEVGEPHQVICVEEGDIFEVSTQHFDTDSFRIMKGDSQLS